MVLDVGDTVSVAPLPTDVPLPQPLLYHFHVPPVPVLPTTLNVVELPLQMLVALAETLCGPHAVVCTVTVTEAHVVVLHVPSART